MTSRGLGVALRAAAGLGVVALLLMRADLRRIADVLSEVRPGFVLAAFGALLLGLVVNAVRWQMFLRPVGLQLPTRELVRLTFVGTFFNAFLPTGFGGDAYKSFRLRTAAGTMAPPLATVVLDRLAGLVGLALLALGGGLVLFATGDREEATLVASLLSLVVLAVWGFALWRSPRWATTEAKRGPFLLFADALATAGRDRDAVSWGTAVGVASALVLTVVFALIGASLDVSLPAGALAGIVLVTSLMTVLPVTINGLGFREAATVWCLGVYGVGRDEALAFALLLLAVTLGTSAVGGVVYVVARGSVPAPGRGASEGFPGRRAPRTRSAG